MNVKSLLKDTALYGLSSIVGRFLNYLLVPLYTIKIAAESGGYGIVTNLYAYTALILVILTFGMETTLFRFCNKEGEDQNRVYGTILKMVGSVGLVFLALVFATIRPLSSALGYPSHPEYIQIMATIVAMDAFQAIMFSRLRQQGRAVKFVILKFAFIIPNILLNLFVFLVMPKLFASHPALQQFYFSQDYGVGLIFIVNLICTALVFLGFIPELKGLKYKFDCGLAKRMLAYSWPLLLLGVMGILNQSADKMLYPHLVPTAQGTVQLGIYGACVKIAMLLAIFTQAFRYAFEPIVFKDNKDKNNPETLAKGMKVFVLTSFFAYLAVIVYLPIIKYFIGPTYWEGLKVVPIVMLAEIFMGIYYNLSYWFKLTDKTWWGAIISGAGAIVMIAGNIWGVPRYGYIACAWSGFAGYGVSMLLSYFIGRKKYPVKYDLRSMLYVACSIVIMGYFIDAVGMEHVALRIVVGTLVLAVVGVSVFWRIKHNK